MAYMLDMRKFKPCLLIAMPQLLDPNFHHTVVLVAEYHSDGAFGLVMNRPIDRTLGQVERQESPVDGRLHDQPVWYGGPVQLDNAMVVFEANTLELVAVLGDKVSALGDNLYITGNTSILTTHAELLSMTRFKVVAGHATWGMAQLDSEIAQSTWLVAPLERNMIFSSFDSMWTRAVQSLGINPTQLATATPAEGESEMAN
jgi:putative transcriptional regulator